MLNTEFGKSNITKVDKEIEEIRNLDESKFGWFDFTMSSICNKDYDNFKFSEYLDEIQIPINYLMKKYSDELSYTEDYKLLFNLRVIQLALRHLLREYKPVFNSEISLTDQELKHNSFYFALVRLKDFFDNYNYNNCFCIVRLYDVSDSNKVIYEHRLTPIEPYSVYEDIVCKNDYVTFDLKFYLCDLSDNFYGYYTEDIANLTCNYNGRPQSGRRYLVAKYIPRINKTNLK